MKCVYCDQMVITMIKGDACCVTHYNQKKIVGDILFKDSENKLKNMNMADY